MRMRGLVAWGGAFFNGSLESGVCGCIIRTGSSPAHGDRAVSAGADTALSRRRAVRPHGQACAVIRHLLGDRGGNGGLLRLADRRASRRQPLGHLAASVSSSRSSSSSSSRTSSWIRHKRPARLRRPAAPVRRQRPRGPAVQDLFSTARGRALCRAPSAARHRPKPRRQGRARGQQIRSRPSVVRAPGRSGSRRSPVHGRFEGDDHRVFMSNTSAARSA